MGTGDIKKGQIITKVGNTEVYMTKVFDGQEPLVITAFLSDELKGENLTPGQIVNVKRFTVVVEGYDPKPPGYGMVVK